MAPYKTPDSLHLPPPHHPVLAIYIHCARLKQSLALTSSTLTVATYPPHSNSQTT